METTSQIQFAIKEIITDQFAVFEENYDPKKQISIGTSIQYKLNVEEKLIGVFMSVEFAHKKTFIKLEGHCGFVVEESSWNNLMNGTQIVFPKDFIVHITRVTVGAMRGILHVRLERTAMNRLHLPLLNVMEYVTGDLPINLNDEEEE